MTEVAPSQWQVLLHREYAGQPDYRHVRVGVTYLATEHPTNDDWLWLTNDAGEPVLVSRTHVQPRRGTLTQAQLREALQAILSEARVHGGAAFGNMQLFNPVLGGLEIWVDHGFDDRFLDLFRLVAPDDPSVCGRAFRMGRQVLVSDVTVDAEFLPYLHIADHAGFRAVQSTPILGRHGSVLGVLSTHFSTPCSLRWDSLETLTKCAGRAAWVIEAA